MHNSNDLLNELHKSQLFVCLINSEHYLISGTILKKCEGRTLSLVKKLTEAMQRIQISGNDCSPQDAEVFCLLYQNLLDKEPKLGTGGAWISKDSFKSFLESLSDTDKEDIRTQRSQFFDIVDYVDSALAFR